LAQNECPYSNPTTAAVYDQIAARLQFKRPAEDLVRFAGVNPGQRVLDVGAGTGVVAIAARAAVGPSGTIVAIDAAFQMLRLIPGDVGCLAISVASELPFIDDTFDVVLAGFAVSHFENYVEGLRAMRRVGRTGSRIGMTAWGSAPNSAATLWSDTAAEYVSRQELNDRFVQLIPWDTWFSNPDNVSRALKDAELAEVVTDTRIYWVRMSSGEYLRSREASVQGLVLRQALTEAKWSEFNNDVAQRFYTTFGEVVEYSRDVHFGFGVKK